MKKPKHRKPKVGKPRTRAAGVGLTRPAPAPASLRSAPAASIGNAGRDIARPSPRFAVLLADGERTARQALRRLRDLPGASVRALPIESEDREVAGLLLLPFLILSAVIALGQGQQFGRHLEALIARRVAPVELPQTAAARQTIAPATTPAGVGQSAIPLAPLRAVQGGTLAALQHQGREIAQAAASAVVPAAPVETTAAHTVTAFESAHVVTGQTPRYGRAASAPVPAVIVALSSAQLADGARPPAVTAGGGTGVRLAALPPPAAMSPAMPRGEVSPAAPARHDITAQGPHGLVPLQTYEDWQLSGGRLHLDERCEPGYEARLVAPAPTEGASLLQLAGNAAVPPAANLSFGRRLAEAARRQLTRFVFYNDAYRAISYPKGDVPSLYGVCTDVVIRAYRALGVDLQVAVHQARVGSGDRNIDHRRTETLRRFFARAGESLPVTSFAEDYLPGDIVTYARPQNSATSSRSHIALVSDVIAPSGRPMILHNRGWGPQLEDALFVDQITGHYRYQGSATAIEPPISKPRPRPRRTAASHAASQPVERAVAPQQAPARKAAVDRSQRPPAAPRPQRTASSGQPGPERDH